MATPDEIQEKTFCKWLNAKLEANGLPPMNSLVTDLSDGVRLIQLMEIMGDTSLGRYNRVPRMRVQKAENVNKALEFITSRGVKLTNIGPEDIIDGNLKLILGMIWTLVLRFTIADITEEGLSAKEGLLLWCQRKTAPYKEVDVQDFSYSWKDGLALCALIHRHRPDLIDYDSLDKGDAFGNTRLAFEVADRHLGIPQILEVEDLCAVDKPDERSVMTYIASYFHAFSSMDQAETVSRRVEKFADLMQSVWISRNDYEKRVKALLEAMRTQIVTWSSATFDGTYHYAKTQSALFNDYKLSTKRTWVTERQDLVSLFVNIQTKLRTYGLKPYAPLPEHSPQALESQWEALVAAEAKRSRQINAEIRSIKDRLQKRFAELADEFESQIREFSSDLAAIEGTLETQQAAVQALAEDLKPMSTRLEAIMAAEQECIDANVEENDYTIFSRQDLEFELELVQQAIAKRLLFIDNQIVSRNMTNLTPAQLEQFESTFRYFDKDETNTLSVSELAAALASLGIVYSEEDIDVISQQLEQEYGATTFEAFINLLVEITEDQTSAEQLREAFRGIAQEKHFVTEMDLQLAQLSDGTIAFLTQTMPSLNEGAYVDGDGGGRGTENGAIEPKFDYERWLDEAFQPS
ncbi:Alpha-actinin-2 AltName: Full=Alpha-actinin skeletal muscle isoform 2; AltName: Full=F-actin cross-linking protein [Serendipita indica DSM 11827]|uniref:Related to alpha-actinin n=1 Tax=Serendipita indica (strain DSM 11827) TaxID=1109443 RepID=G4TNT1_SERID|nr:Alpha-actinin-2 AltName: Full=Alpha-actinin skeletal muscle isoform 2; AltName: Full=F-actin cross-linking protein [Serendipita indica DSM 11827]CCA72974.1 related to alpha-actinin [Serendipita indica DSM 11827]